LAARAVFEPATLRLKRHLIYQ